MLHLKCTQTWRRAPETPSFILKGYLMTTRVQGVSAIRHIHLKTRLLSATVHFPSSSCPIITYRGSFKDKNHTRVVAGSKNDHQSIQAERIFQTSPGCFWGLLSRQPQTISSEWHDDANETEKENSEIPWKPSETFWTKATFSKTSKSHP